MAFWTWLGHLGTGGITPNDNEPPPPPGTVGPTGWTPGDPHGVEVDDGEAPPTTLRLSVPRPSPWSGWPADWATPNWDMGSRLNELVDVAWTCLDLNANVLSAMPVYRTRNGRVIGPTTWMGNPDPTIYTSWHEFAKQLFWDYQLGEAFVLPVARQSDGYPLTFRVVPPWMMHVEMKGGVRRYRLGGISGPDVTDEVLHIRYKSSTDSAHGVGPLEQAGGRMLTAGILAKYVREVVSTGGVPTYTLETEQPLDEDEAQDLLNMWVASRSANLGAPPVLDNNVHLQTHMAMSPKDMAMLEITQFTEARIAVLTGVPPTIVALPSGDSQSYSNVQQVFDFHDRASLKVKATHVMAALSWWGLPPGENAELNRDEYTRPALAERAAAYQTLHAIGAVTAEEVRVMERLPNSIAAGAEAVARSDQSDPQAARNIAEMVQKLYLGVGVVITADEAREIVNQAGGSLPSGFTSAKATNNGRPRSVEEGVT
jgi:HK97 family phage portal protein